MSILRPILLNAVLLLLGALFGLLLHLFMLQKHSDDNRLIMTIALLFAFCGICALAGLSPLLGCMAFGMSYINISGDDKLFKQLNYFTPPILLLFFVHSGLAFRLDALTNQSLSVGSVPLLTIGIVYFIVRIAGKYLGAFLGCLAVKKEASTRNFLGLALIPQAGVAIGLAMLGARTIGGEAGSALQTVILASSVLYELAGPACAKASLYLSGAIPKTLEEMVEVPEVDENGQEKTAAELLVERIQAIQEENRRRAENAEEEAFTEAAEELRARILGEQRTPGPSIRFSGRRH